ncbi:MAG: TatD family hydrolase, partial [Planctomycetes bacterium]|nr:TatD family hydrolase [Planctomycetota bacterium]
MIDSHAHLDHPHFDPDRDEVIARAREAGVSAIVNIGVGVESAERCVALARAHEGFRAAAGLHPAMIVEDLEGSLARIEALARENPGVV